jgi:hypothetical protein
MAAYQEKRLAVSQALTVASAAGAAVSTTIFGSETYAIAFPDSVSSTGGMRIAVIDVGAAVVSSTTGTFLPANWIQNFKVSPGQRVSVISNDAGTPSLSHYRTDEVEKCRTGIGLPTFCRMRRRRL